jgi:hypothetical protein
MSFKLLFEELGILMTFQFDNEYLCKKYLEKLNESSHYLIACITVGGRSQTKRKSGEERSDVCTILWPI